jgi:hypothetical protein
VLPRFVTSRTKRGLAAALLVATPVAFPLASLRAEPSGVVWRQVPAGTTNLQLRAVSCPSSRVRAASAGPRRCCGM